MSAHLARTSRRTFLLGAGGAVAGGADCSSVGLGPVLAGATTSQKPSATPVLDVGSLSTGGLKGDLAVAAVAASLENLAVYAYKAGLSAATAGKLGTVPPAVATFVTTAALPAHATRRGVERRAGGQQ